MPVPAGPRFQRAALRLGLALAIAVVLSPRTTGAQVLRDDLWIPNGPVSAIVPAGDRVIIGGSFDRVSPATGGFVAVDDTTAKVIPPFPRVAGVVRAIASDGAGGWFLGGSFAAVGGQLRANLAHVDAAGNLTAWNPGADFDVLALGTDPFNPAIVYAGGMFSNAGGVPRHGLAAIDASTGAVTAWNPDPQNGGLGVRIDAILVRGSSVLVAGRFSGFGGVTRNNLAAIDAATGTPTGWNPDVNGEVHALAVTSLIHYPFTATVWFGGNFTSVAGQQRYGLAAVDGGTAALTGWSPNSDHEVDALVAYGGVLYAAGTFTTIGGQYRPYLAAVDGTGALTAWNPAPNNPVRSIAFLNGTLYAGGSFSSIGGQPRANAAAIDAGGAATSWDPEPNAEVDAVVAGPGALMLGGTFSGVGGVARTNLAALDLATGEATSWNPYLNGTVRALASLGGTLYAGGEFTYAGAGFRDHLAAYDLGTGALTAWNPDADGPVSAMAARGSTVWVGGGFSTVSSLPRPRLAAIDLAGVPTPWNPIPEILDSAPYPISAIVANDTSVFVGGGFDRIDGISRQHLASFTTAGNLRSWAPYTEYATFGKNSVTSLALSGNLLFVGGTFQKINGNFTARLASVSVATGTASGWAPSPASDVDALAVDDGTLYVGGFVSVVAGEVRYGLASFAVPAGTLTAWDPSPGGEVFTVAPDGGGHVFVGGLFEGAGATSHAYFAELFASVTGVGEDGRRPSPTGLCFAPNPFRSDVLVRFAQPRPGPAEVTIHDVAGRLVRRLTLPDAPAGERQFRWDGTSDAGAAASAGVYFVRVRTPGFASSGRVLEMK